jgi:hypothetical protein
MHSGIMQVRVGQEAAG